MRVERLFQTDDTMNKYEAWEDEDSVTFATPESIRWQKDNNLLGRDLKLLYTIDADTHEEAMAVHHIRMGWEPYVPNGKPEQCPNHCGFIYYPNGSGECPNCGKVAKNG